MSATASTPFPANSFLRGLVTDRKSANFRRNEIIFMQGDSSDSIFFLERGSVKLTVTANDGREAIIAIVDGGDFFGEGCVSSEVTVREHSAVALTEVRTMRVERKQILAFLDGGNPIVFTFLTYVLQRTAQAQERLANTLLYSSGERLARALLSIANVDSRTPKISQQMLAEMTGITRQRVNFLMQQFKRLGFVDYKRGWRVHSALKVATLGDLQKP